MTHWFELYPEEGLAKARATARARARAGVGAGAGWRRRWRGLAEGDKEQA